MATKEAQYIEGVGRRKTAIARVRITPSKSASIVVNERDIDDFFKTEIHRAVASAALAVEGVAEKFTVTAKVAGSGPSSQAEAVRLGVARALIKHNPKLRAELKKLGYLKRDPRAVERKHFGLRKARRAPQWSKR
jgi:small subunit ribosomal protein S9